MNRVYWLWHEYLEDFDARRKLGWKALGVILWVFGVGAILASVVAGSTAIGFLMLMAAIPTFGFMGYGCYVFMPEEIDMEREQ